MKANRKHLEERLHKLASRSVCKYRIAAIGLNGRGVPMSVATNISRFRRKGGAIHAEMKVMKNSPRSLKTIVIYRIGAMGDPLPIVACEACQTTANKRGVNIVSLQEWV